MKTKVCVKAGCGRTALPGKDFCRNHISMQEHRDRRRIFTRRGKSEQWHVLYESAEWRKVRAAFLKKYPSCFICGSPAVIADHIIPHRGDLTLFYDTDNLQPMCQSCHSRKTFKENNNFHKDAIDEKTRIY